jgi:DNA polymerase-3 subunit delta'
LDKEGNALLKMIEEPQPNTLFILGGPKSGSDPEYHPVAYTAHKIPCLNYEDIKSELMNKYHQTETAASEIAYLSNGNMTEALAMLQHDTKSYHTLFVQWLRLMFW